jgi:peptidoglycan/xylan/chitin deacetylase (PgdA/CDA1 family)
VLDQGIVLRLALARRRRGLPLAGLALAALLASSLLPARRAAADGWPQPAAGLSLTGDPEILFTFDDGPNPTTTPAILDALHQYGIHAVFFLVGHMVVQPKAQPIIDRILAEGHVVANHTMEHAELCVVKEDQAIHEIDEGHRVIAAAAAMPIPWFRAPYGAKCHRLEAELAERRITHFHWDVDPQEWRHGNTKRTIAYMLRVLGRTQGRAVILMHDTKVATMHALPVILQWIQEENARREAEGRRPIRVVQSWQYALENLAPGLWKWLVDAAPGPSWSGYLAAVLP